MRKKIISILCASLLFSCSLFAGCTGGFVEKIKNIFSRESSENQIEIKFYNDLIYVISDDGKGIRVIGHFTNSEIDNSRIVLPKAIENLPIIGLGITEEEKNVVDKETNKNWDFISGDKVIYVGQTIYEVDYNYAISRTKILCIEEYMRERDWRVFVNLANYQRRKGSGIIVLRTHEVDEYGGTLPANVGYMYNYENAPNDNYYWIDDYNGTTIEYIPKEPVREGYTFGGWYKEPECINPWNFETDIVPVKIFEKVYFDGLIYHYEETRLYAKWNLNI